MLSLEFIKAHPIDAAKILEGLLPEEIVSFLQEVPISDAANMIHLMDPISGARYLMMMGAERSGAIIAILPVEISSLLLRRMERPFRESVLATLPRETEEPLHRLLTYPEGTAGALMDPHAFTLPEDIPAREGLKRVRRTPHHVTDHIYVVNREKLLVGLTSLRDLMLSPPNVYVFTLMHTHVEPLSANSPPEVILAHPGWLKFHTLPVVDEGGRFLGTIEYQNLRRLERRRKEHREEKPLSATAKALGELYWVGLIGLIKGAASAMGEEGTPRE